MPKLLDMPQAVVSQILEKLDPKDLLVSRKLCQKLRTAVDKFGIHFNAIEVICTVENIILKLNESLITYTNSSKSGTTVTYECRRKTIENEDFTSRAFKDLEIILEQQVPKFTFRIELYDSKRKNQKNMAKFITSFINFLKAKKCIHVKEVHFNKLLFDDILSILPFFNAKVLENIKLSETDNLKKFNRLACLEQWKNAKTFETPFVMDNNCQIPIEQLFHLEKFKIIIDDFFKQNAIDIRNDLLRRSTFRKCEISFEKLNSTSFEIAELFKPDLSKSDKYEIEYSINCKTFKIISSSHRFICEIL